MGKEKDFSRKSNLSQLSDDEILQGFKDADARIVREYYYGYCRVAYCIYDKRYDLQNEAGHGLLFIGSRILSLSLRTRLQAFGGQEAEHVAQDLDGEWFPIPLAG